MEEWLRRINCIIKQERAGAAGWREGAADADGIDDVVVCSPVCCHHHLVLCRSVIKEVKNLDPKKRGEAKGKGSRGRDRAREREQGQGQGQDQKQSEAGQHRGTCFV